MSNGHNIRILGIPLDNTKPLYLALRKIKGLGPSRIRLLLDRAHLLIKSKIKLGKLNQNDIYRLTIRLNYFRLIKKWRLYIKLSRLNYKGIGFLINIKSYRGLRHQFKRPARGQRTRSNRRTRRLIRGKYKP